MIGASSPEARVDAEYRARLSSRRATLDTFERRHVAMSRVRLALVAGAIIAWLAAPAAAWPWWVAGLVVAYLTAAVVHARVIESRDRGLRAVGWYERGLERLDHAWIGHGDPGDRLAPATHLYAADLDLFGRGSLFELLSTPRTRGGQDRLAAWLLAPASPEVVLARQAAVRELAALPDLRETIAVVGEGVHVEAAPLREWATAPARLPARWLVWPAGLLSAVNLAALLVYLSTGTYARTSLALMTLLALVALALRPRVRPVIHAVETPTRELEVLSGLLRVIEDTTFHVPALRRIASAIGGSRRAASAEIARLDGLAGRLAWRQNLIFGPPALLMLWATQCAFAIDGWRARVGPRVAGWLDAVGELEALAALATFAAEHPSYVYPVIEQDAPPAHLAATGLAHPLLPRSAVANDVALGREAPGVFVVSGSNMSGKSTLLRALGVNVVLAEAGGPVRATSFRLTPLEIGASIRVLDSLQDGRSRFFAEISRLKQLVDLTRAHPGGVLFLLDEILAGTNSHDRAEGADALLAGLARAGAIGLVTTHDLALSRIADARAPRAANVHFADEFDEGGLSFDYRLRPGPVRTSNALVLMRSIGLDV
jgi:membrane protein YdbS with pleckstrin-like domain